MSAQNPQRIRGLDAVRAVCALWVVMGHASPPPLLAGIDRSTFAGWLLGGIYNNLWSGPAAVIVFFVISGFCIHYPQAGSLRIPSLFEYGTRRYFRIGLPLLVAVPIAACFDVKLHLFHDSILWSLVAELVYYSLYPAFLQLRRHGISWRWIFLVAFGFATLLAMTDPPAKNYPSWGVGLNWVLGLPCWILGCIVAEQRHDQPAPGEGQIWRWRVGVWAAASLCSVLRFHSPLGYPWTLNLFALLAAGWLKGEVRRYREREPFGWLEWMGKWSYSTYLIHVPALAAFSMLPLPNLGYLLHWLLQIAFVLSCSYLFYLLVERPAHSAARVLGRSLARVGAVRRAAGPSPDTHPTSR